MSGRTAFTSSVLMSSGAFGEHSDVDSDDDDLAGNFEDVASDEEQEVLLWDSSVLGARDVPQLNDDEDFDTDLLADSILEDMQRLQIGIPKLEDVMMGVVVNFWEEVPGTGGATFLLETSEIMIPGETLRSFCTETRLAPMRIRIPIVCDDDENDDDSMPELSGSDGDGDARVVAKVGEEDEVGDVRRRQWIPERGYVNVLLAMYGQAPVISGLLSEGFDLGTSPQVVSYSEGTLESFNNNGKRIVWLDSAEGAVKRARGANGDTPTHSQDSGAALPDDGMSGFAADGNEEWTNKTNRHDVTCSFEREAGTGVLKEVRLALALHSPRMRTELQAILATSRNTM